MQPPAIGQLVRLATWFCVVDFLNCEAHSISHQKGKFAPYPHIAKKYTRIVPTEKLAQGEPQRTSPGTRIAIND